MIYEDTPEIFPNNYPMSDCALYFGWYAGTVAGPFTQPDFQFAPGAIAVHIHSFSASTLHDEKANWAGPLVTKGAAATIGNVYEPYLGLTAHLNIFNDRLLHGFTFAESAYMSVQTLSWQSVMVGDPLYRPYAIWLDLAEKTETQKAASDWSAYHDFALRRIQYSARRRNFSIRAAAKQFAARTRNAPMLEDLPAQSKQQARQTTSAPRGQLFRSGARDLHETRRHSAHRPGGGQRRLAKQNQPKRGASDLVAERAADCPGNAPSFGVVEEARSGDGTHTGGEASEAAPPLTLVLDRVLPELSGSRIAFGRASRYDDAAA